MSEKIAIVYIGEKNVKRDTITGSRAVFPRLQPVHVDSEVAYQLLEFKDVWVRHEQMEETLKQQEEEKRLKEEELARQLEDEARLAAENSFVVNVQSDELDISKYTSAHLMTLSESEELGLKKGAKESTDDFRVRVRDALKVRGVQDGFAE
ncbi:hypothetical protein FJC35_19130 [Salmonella enterica]|uniref:Uncharacterized protein n=1 Tax=Salmonella enterica TaxID=28901 RepID=A0A5U3IHE1_SALER|nr:hypothetical protein [Salmonella enterica]EBZ1027314.1 hypothetical protein [Salmonella enterica subsp. enterica serovar Muenchen]ECU8748714.1 hypothetical protein [Salmonella enterica subsp. diarizonae str. CFSAN000558]EDX2599776.1 hypothetical protein [Salmonella enterica subsp. enterica serovar Pomona]EEF7939554.1 hypothetical protein [Salmonella enterica subsp. diarizonae]HAE8381937.1 hypothetical protein [Salmonella enterica subsp. diarizonae serovar 50:k:z]